MRLPGEGVNLSHQMQGPDAGVSSPGYPVAGTDLITLCNYFILRLKWEMSSATSLMAMGSEMRIQYSPGEEVPVAKVMRLEGFTTLPLLLLLLLCCPLPRQEVIE